MKLLEKLRKNQFLFEELVKRDFKKKYKGTALGMLWSVLSPLLTLLIMRLVFTQFFGRNTPHYTIYLFCGNLVMSFYKESTKGGMKSLTSNASIFTKVNIPKYMFLLSKNVSSVINFLLTLTVFVLFCFLDDITFTWRWILLIFPIVCLTVFNIGVGLTLSALLVFFRDVEYLYDIFLTLLTYLSAIFYTLDRFPETIQRLFMLNPVYCYIRYFRIVVIECRVPSLAHHALCLGYALILILIGGWIYKRYNHKFLYYV